jgi:hypothetical protein
VRTPSDRNHLGDENRPHLALVTPPHSDFGLLVSRSILHGATQLAQELSGFDQQKMLLSGVPQSLVATNTETSLDIAGTCIEPSSGVFRFQSNSVRMLYRTVLGVLEAPIGCDHTQGEPIAFIWQRWKSQSTL